MKRLRKFAVLLFIVTITVSSLYLLPSSAALRFSFEGTEERDGSVYSYYKSRGEYNPPVITSAGSYGTVSGSVITFKRFACVGEFIDELEGQYITKLRVLDSSKAEKSSESKIITGDLLEVTGTEPDIIDYYTLDLTNAKDDVTVTYDSSSKTIKLTSQINEKVNVIAASYKDGALAGCIYNVISLTTSGYNMSISSLDTKNADSLKIYVWNASNLSPITDVYEIPTAADEILKVQNGYLTDSEGNKVVLKGVNFGGWLLQETWMCPVLPYSTVTSNGKTVDWAHLDTLDMLESKLGKTEAAKLMQLYYDNYITEADFKKVADMGFNCVRIPFWYRNFMSDEDGTYITENDDDNPGFKKLDWAVEMAEKYNLYLIFDMHGCPGGQSGDHSTGKSGRNYLYFEEKYQDIMEELWVRIANRYKYCSAIAAYDIMNEPFNNCDSSHGVKSEYCGGVWDNPTTQALVNNLYDRMIKAIRKTDSMHAITVEGIWRVNRLPNPKDMGWDNMIYQLHSYDSDQSTVSALAVSLKNARTNYGVDGLFGEFNPQVYYNSAVDEFNKYDLSYTLWNYKTEKLAVYGTPTTWGLYYKNFSDSNVNTILNEAGFSDSEKSTISSGYLNGLSADAIKRFYTVVWSSKWLSTNNFTLNSTLKSYLK